MQALQGTTKLAMNLMFEPATLEGMGVKPYTASDMYATRRLLPFQNHFLLRHLFDAAQDGFSRSNDERVWRRQGVGDKLWYGRLSEDELRVERSKSTPAQKERARIRKEQRKLKKIAAAQGVS